MPTKRTRAAISKANDSAGKSAETLFVYWCRALGLKMVKTYPPFVIEKRLTGARFIGRLEAKAEPDYVGRYAGRPVAAEVKSTTANTYPHSALPAHQRRALYECATDDGIPLLAILFPDGLAVWRFPIEGWRPGTSLTYAHPAKLGAGTDLTHLLPDSPLP